MRSRIGNGIIEHLLRAREKNGPEEEPDDPALGKSRGGIGTKVHLVCDGKGLPITVEITPGQAHEAKLCLEVIDELEIVSSVGRPRKALENSETPLEEGRLSLSALLRPPS